MKWIRYSLLIVVLALLAATAARAQELDLVGNTGWEKVGGRIRIHAERIDNNRDRGVSGFLRLHIWAVPTVYDGSNALTGYVLGTYNLGTLSAGYSFVNGRALVRYNRPPPGLYYTLITLEESTTGGYVIADYENFDGLINLGSFGGGTATGAGSNGDINFTGPVSWEAGGGKVQLFAEKILNERAVGRSGNLRLRLWATSTPYLGVGILQGYPMATKLIGRLKAEYYFPNVSKTVPFRAPPTGTYYVTMTLEEYAPGGWGIVDHVTFEETSLF